MRARFKAAPVAVPLAMYGWLKMFCSIIPASLEFRKSNPIFAVVENDTSAILYIY